MKFARIFVGLGVAAYLALINARADAAALDPTPQERSMYCHEYSWAINQLAIMRMSGMTQQQAIRQFFASPISLGEAEEQILLAHLGRDSINKLVDGMYTAPRFTPADLAHDELIHRAYNLCLEGKMLFIDD